MKRILVLTLLTIVLSGLILFFYIRSKGGAITQKINLKTSDGVDLVADYYAGQKKQSPAVILAHMLPADKSSWEKFAIKLQEQGFVVMAIDFRGHGESTIQNGKPIDYHNFSNAEFKASVADLQAAYEYLKADPSVNFNQISLVGASIGANLSLNFAANQFEVYRLVLISPGLDYRGVTTNKAIELYNDRPIFLISAKDDEDSYNDTQKLIELSPSSQKETKIFDSGGHGNALFKSHPELEQEIIDWLKR